MSEHDDHKPGVYQRRATTVEAIQWDGSKEGHEALRAWGVSVTAWQEHGSLQFFVAKSRAQCSLDVGGWVAAEADGDGFYPITSEVFGVTYYEPDVREAGGVEHQAEADAVALLTDLPLGVPDVARLTLVRVGYGVPTEDGRMRSYLASTPRPEAADGMVPLYAMVPADRE